MTQEEKLQEITEHCRTHHCDGRRNLCIFRSPMILESINGFCLISEWEDGESMELADPLLVDYLYGRLIAAYVDE